MSKKKLVLIDGNSLLYRAFYALPTTLATSSGMITNAVYGFTSMLIRLIKDVNPDCLAVAFDKGILTFRHEAFKEYKAHREETPDELRHQFGVAKELLKSLNIPIYEKEGFEADDILATAAKQAEEAGSKVLVVTGDRDAFQLISDEVKVMTTRRGITDIVIYDKEKLNERYGITPEKMPDMLGLKGDPSDNIPGVPGVGEKTAAKLIQEFGNVENIYSHIDKVKGEKLKENLRNFKEQAKISKELATLHFKVPLDFSLGKCQLKWNIKKASETFFKLEFNTLLDRLKKLTFEDEKESYFKPSWKKSSYEQISDKLKKAKKVALNFLKENNKIISILLSFGDSVYALEANELKKIKPYLEDKNLKKLTFDSKSLFFALQFDKIRLAGVIFDVQLAAYLLQPTRANYTASDLGSKYLKLYIGEVEDNFKQAVINCYLAYHLKKPLANKLAEKKLEKVYYKLELPLSPILAAMEYCGIGINKKELKTYSKELSQMIYKLEEDIYRLAGVKFNINSPAQLSPILFENLKLKPIKKTKTGYSTDSTVLAKLINEHPIIEKIINYRELAKIKSTYVDALPKMVNPKTKRLHTTFNQTVTATGRLSSSNPNLQNIPIRTDIGKRIRRAFVPAKDTDSLLIADYSQIELRVLAHFSKDENLSKAFEEHKDIHKATAAEVFGLPVDKVSERTRRKAKAVNFGIVYGISSFGLAQQLQIDTKEAATYIEMYFNRYPKVRSFIDKTVSDAFKKGFVKTLYGRRRYLPELKSNDVRVRNFGERSAINSLIQGSAADIIKQAMINVENTLIADDLMSKMVLQVHDELIFEVTDSEKSTLSSIVKKQMESAYNLRPSLEVNISTGPNWLEAK